MNNKIKDFIIRFLLVLSLVLGTVMILFPFVCDLFFEPTVSKDLMKFLLITVLCIGSFTIILLNFWGLSQKKSKIERIKVDFKNYEDMKHRVIPILFKNGYNIIGEIALNNESEVLIFTQRFLCKHKCFLVVKSNEFTEEIRLEINEIFKKTVYDYYGKKFFTNNLYLTSLVCVNRVSPLFYDFLSGYNINSFKEFYYNTGLSFGGKTLYVPLKNDGLSINKSKKMKLDFQNIIEEAQRDG